MKEQLKRITRPVRDLLESQEVSRSPHDWPAAGGRDS